MLCAVSRVQITRDYPFPSQPLEEDLALSQPFFSQGVFFALRSWVFPALQLADKVVDLFQALPELVKFGARDPLALDGRADLCHEFGDGYCYLHDGDDGSGCGNTLHGCCTVSVRMGCLPATLSPAGSPRYGRGAGAGAELFQTSHVEGALDWEKMHSTGV